jgi:hypothetical protein
MRCIPTLKAVGLTLALLTACGSSVETPGNGSTGGARPVTTGGASGPRTGPGGTEVPLAPQAR